MSRLDVRLVESRDEQPAVGVRLTGRSSLPAGFRPEDVLGLDRSRVGYVPVLEAAARMGLTLAEVEGLAAEGWLDWQARGDGLWVSPVVLSRLRVRDSRIEPEPEPVAEFVPTSETTEPAEDALLERFGVSA